MTRYRAECECGDQSSAVPSRVVAESWADEHRATCEVLSGRPRTVEIVAIETAEEADR